MPVGADWTDNTKILGFYNPLGNEGKGKYEKTDVLKLIERANLPENVYKPFFLILDEMNLSRVERYFADFLSHMETPDLPFKLDGYEGEIRYPSNLFVVGTVNIDETTYMFSPKVLDRANVIEFRPDEEDVMRLFRQSTRDLNIIPANSGTPESFLKLASEIQRESISLPDNMMSEVERIFHEAYEITVKSGYEFAYRTVKEVKHYIFAAYELNKDGFDHNHLLQAIDEQLLQKVLPKIHGNRKEIGMLLNNLEQLCVDEGLNLSKDKISQMKDKLAAVQYASFI